MSQTFFKHFKLSKYSLKLWNFSISNALITLTFIKIYYLRSLTSSPGVLVNISLITNSFYAIFLFMLNIFFYGPREFSLLVRTIHNICKVRGSNPGKKRTFFYKNSMLNISLAIMKQLHRQIWIRYYTSVIIWGN